MTRPKFTIVIPTWNRAQMLSRAVASALSQTLEDIEIYISDNGSTDGTASLVRSLDDPRVHYRPLSKNIGLHGNFNRCLGFGTAPYLAFLHDDDAYHPENLQRKADFFDLHPSVGAVHSPVDQADVDGTVYRPHLTFGVGTRPGVEPGWWFIRRQMRQPGLTQFSATALRRSAIGNNRFDVEDGMAPTDVGLRLRMAIDSDIGFIDEALTVHTRHRGSVTTREILEAGSGELATNASLQSVRELTHVKRRFIAEHGNRLHDDPSLLWRLAVRGQREQLARALYGVARLHPGYRHVGAKLLEAARIDPLALAQPETAKAVALTLLGGRGHRMARGIRDLLRSASRAPRPEDRTSR